MGHPVKGRVIKLPNTLVNKVQGDKEGIYIYRERNVIRGEERERERERKEKVEVR